MSADGEAAFANLKEALAVNRALRDAPIPDDDTVGRLAWIIALTTATEVAAGAALSVAIGVLRDSVTALESERSSASIPQLAKAGAGDA